MTTEEAKELKVGDRFRLENARYATEVWEVDQVVEKGVVAFITGYSYKSHKGLWEWSYFNQKSRSGGVNNYVKV
jgi:hypothetical protein